MNAKRIKEISRHSSSRHNFRLRLAVAWMRKNAPAELASIDDLADEKFPKKHNGRAKSKETLALLARVEKEAAK